MGETVLSYETDTDSSEAGDGWLAATTGQRMLLLPAADSTAAARIWASLSATAPGADEGGARAVLDELTSAGLSRTPPFALVTWDAASPTTVRVIVRGAVRVNVHAAEGEVVMNGSGVSTWMERAIDGVRAVTVSAPDGTAPPRSPGLTLPLERGMVRSRRLSADFSADFSGDGTAESRIVTPTAAAVVPVPVPVTVPVPVPVPSPAPTSSHAHPASEQTITDLAGTDSSVPASEAPGPSPSESAESADDDGGYDHLFGATVMRGVEQAAVRPEIEADEADDRAVEQSVPTVALHAVAVPIGHTADSAVEDIGDHDGHTVMSGDLRKLRGNRPPAQGAAPAAAARLYLLLPSGAREQLTQPIRVGRAPSVTQMSGGQVPRLVSLGGADQDVSRNHVHFTVEGDTVVVTDLHSRNGTFVILPGKPAQKLRQGEPTAVIVGTVVDLGSGITITVGQE